MQQNKTGIRKKIIIGVIVAAGVTGGTYGALAAVRNSSRKPVKVYAVGDVAQTDYWADQQESYGTVSSDQIQNVFLSGTQSVSKVFVQKGQQVKAGDPLLAYDTTLSQINIEKAENDLNQQRRALDLAKKELVKMQKTKPVDSRKIVPPNEIDNENSDAGGDQNPESDPEEYPGDDNGGNTDLYPGGREDDHGNNGNEIVDPGENEDPEHPADPSEQKPDYQYKLDTNYQGKPIGEPRSYDTPALLDGIGTIERPAIWIWSEDNELSEQLLKQMFNTTLAARKKEEAAVTKSTKNTETSLVGRTFRDSDEDCYLVLRQYVENNPGHKKIAEHGIQLELKGDKLEVSLFNPDLLAIRTKTKGTDSGTESDLNEADSVSEENQISEIPGEESGDDNGTDGISGGEDTDGGSGRNLYDEDGSDEGDAEGDNVLTVGDSEGVAGDGVASSGNKTDADADSGENYAAMTRAELNKAMSDQKSKIRDQEIVWKLAEINLRQMKHEVSDGVVRSKISGTVKNVVDPEKAYEKNKACVSVSNGGGYTVRCSISELSLSRIKKGMSATVMSTDTGNSEEGRVIGISTTPTSGDNYGSSNNPNVSYYDCTIQIPESDTFKENDFVSVSFGNGSSSQKGLFLDGMFIRSDDDGSYVYIKGKDKKLEKRYIRTGRDIGGGTLEILRGLTLKDRIAFPYGSDVENGAKTKNASTDSLYG